eukprot:SAG11_NODE_11645_length_747_cov_0.824074_1_plen_89_part_00
MEEGEHRLVLKGDHVLPRLGTLHVIEGQHVELEGGRAVRRPIFFEGVSTPLATNGGGWTAGRLHHDHATENSSHSAVHATASQMERPV